jgi:hypothetical protein
MREDEVQEGLFIAELGDRNWRVTGGGRHMSPQSHNKTAFTVFPPRISLAACAISFAG